jgi:L-fuconolactonase
LRTEFADTRRPLIKVPLLISDLRIPTSNLVLPMIIDSHHHLWDRSLTQFDHSWQENEGLEKICKTFLPEDLKPRIDAAGVDKTVFVQTQHNLEENRWALGLAEQHDWIAGVVGWVDLASSDCESQVEEFVDNPKFVGVRHVVQDEPNDDFIVQDDVLHGLGVLEKYGVPYDLLFYVKHLKHAATVARKFPNLKFVIDHLAKPVIKEEKTEGWIENFAAAANCENVWCKLSGMVTEADWKNWKPHDLKPYVETALENFGTDRCMFGSDWPVCELAASYQQVFDALANCISGVSDTEKAKILGLNAIEFYDLKV